MTLDQLMEKRKEYRNAIRSKQLIRNAFLELLNEKSFDRITATDIINRADIASMTRVDNVIGAITLLTGKKAFRIYQETKTPFNGSTVEFAEGAVTNKVNKNAAFVVLNDGPLVTKNIIDPMLNGEFVVILGRKWNNSTGDAKWRVVGAETGAKCTATSLDVDNADVDGGWSVTLTESNAPTSAVYFYDTDAATTIASLEALC